MSRGVCRISFREGLEHMASAVARAYNGGLGQSPQRGPGAEPLVGVRGAKPPEAESFLLWDVQMKWQNWPISGKNLTTHLDLEGARSISGYLESVKWLLNWLIYTEYDQSALQRRDALKEIGWFYTRQEKTPKMFTISEVSFSPVSPLLCTPLKVRWKNSVSASVWRISSWWQRRATIESSCESAEILMMTWLTAGCVCNSTRVHTYSPCCMGLRRSLMVLKSGLCSGCSAQHCSMQWTMKSAQSSCEMSGLHAAESVSGVFITPATTSTPHTVHLVTPSDVLVNWSRNWNWNYSVTGNISQVIPVKDALSFCARRNAVFITECWRRW